MILVPSESISCKCISSKYVSNRYISKKYNLRLVYINIKPIQQYTIIPIRSEWKSV